jgi:hypothetical protein
MQHGNVNVKWFVLLLQETDFGRFHKRNSFLRLDRHMGVYHDSIVMLLAL